MTPTVHFLKFPFTPEQSRRFAAGPGAHRGRPSRLPAVAELTDEQRAELLGDLRESGLTCRSASSASIPICRCRPAARRRRRLRPPTRAKARCSSRAGARRGPDRPRDRDPFGLRRLRAAPLRPRAPPRHHVPQHAGPHRRRYRGEIRVLLVNTDPSEPFTVQPRRPHRAARRPAGRDGGVGRGRRARRPSAARRLRVHRRSLTATTYIAGLAPMRASPSHARSRRGQRPQVPVRRAGRHRRRRASRGATGRARSKTSATRRCSCPITSAQELAPLPAIAIAAAHTTRCASACSCSATTTSTRRSSPRKPRRSTCCPTAGSSSASARVG